jgi:hypothetical protein
MDHSDGQEHAPSGQPGYGDPSRHAHIGGPQVQLAAKQGETEKELVQ